MNPASKSERQQLRELCWLLLPQIKCKLCGRQLLVRPADMTFGHRRHVALKERFTVHHVDHNRYNNMDTNLTVVHQACHRKYHAEVNRGERERTADS